MDKLLDTNNRNICGVALFARIDQVVIHLARASQNAFDFLVIDAVINLAQHGVERTFDQLRERRTCILVPQQ